MSNFEHIFGPVYVVRNQTGFKQACKHFTDREVVEQVPGYPTTYPAMISLEIVKDGGMRGISAHSENLILVKAKLEKI